MSDINDTSNETSENSEFPTPEPDPANPKPEPESPGSDPGDIKCLPPPPSAHVRHLPHIEQDSLLTARREQRGNRHEPYDPILRHHLGLPPLPDPHEERRRRAEAWQKVRHKYVK